MKSCLNCKHYAPCAVFEDERAHNFAVCTRPQLDLPPSANFVTAQRKGGLIASLILGTCGNRGRWHVEPK